MRCTAAAAVVHWWAGSIETQKLEQRVRIMKLGVRRAGRRIGDSRMGKSSHETASRLRAPHRSSVRLNGCQSSLLSKHNARAHRSEQAQYSILHTQQTDSHQYESVAHVFLRVTIVFGLDPGLPVGNR